jgi:starvation-inducible DNA-binding protein
MTEEQSVSELGNSLKVVLADTFVMMTQALGYHWDVEGPHFQSLHLMFGKIYEDLWSAVDPLAEHIRALDEYAPGSLKRFQELTTIEEDVKIPTASNMVTRLLETNQKVIDSLNQALEQAKVANDEGVINFLGERLETHAKHGWFLRATAKKDRG